MWISRPPIGVGREKNITHSHSLRGACGGPNLWDTEEHKFGQVRITPPISPLNSEPKLRSFCQSFCSIDEHIEWISLWSLHSRTVPDILISYHSYIIKGGLLFYCAVQQSDFILCLKYSSQCLSVLRDILTVVIPSSISYQAFSSPSSDCWCKNWSFSLVSGRWCENAMFSNSIINNINMFLNYLIVKSLHLDFLWSLSCVFHILNTFMN